MFATDVAFSSMTELSVGLLILRVAFGLTMAAHGYGKFFQGGRIPGTAGWFDSMGMRPGKVHAVLAATSEVASGLAIALGLLTPFAGGLFIALMIVAGYTVHAENGFFIVKSGWEYNFILAVFGLGIAMVGPGEYSLDHAFGIADTLSGWTGLIIALIVGVGGGIGQLVVFYRPPAKTS